MKLIDLFSGIGGFSLAAHWMGWETIAFCEQDKFCQRVLRKNFPGVPIFDDVRTFNGTSYRGTADIVCGGFPCQPFSSNGKRQGTSDDRYLWPEMLRIIQETAPRFVVAENVYGMLDWSDGLVFDRVQFDLEDAGYKVWAGVLPACGLGAPHRRYRIWFVAHTESKQGLYQSHHGKASPRLPHYSTAWEAGSWDASESKICRVDDGIPARVDRSDRLGNSIVPQLAYSIFRAIEAAEGMTD